MHADPIDRHRPFTRAVHWFTALCILVMLPVGAVLLDLPPGPIQDTAFDLHRSTGVLLLALTCVRLAHRLVRPPPPLPAHLTTLQRRLAHLTHAALYLLLLAMPVVGWWATSAYGAPINVFWLFELPPIAAVDRAAAERAFALHGMLGWAIVATVAVHACAALHHHFVRRDGVLRRML